jgi:hypothetical protein
MLCPKCEAIRFPSSSAPASGSNAKKAQSSVKTNASSKSKPLSTADGRADETDESDSTQVKTLTENAVAINALADSHSSSELQAAKVTDDLSDLRKLVVSQQLIKKNCRANWILSCHFWASQRCHPNYSAKVNQMRPLTTYKVNRSPTSLNVLSRARTVTRPRGAPLLSVVIADETLYLATLFSKLLLRRSMLTRRSKNVAK